MHSLQRSEFLPPPAPGLLRSLILALLAHALLVAALTWGVQWKREAQTISVQAELWAALPQQAAPPLVEPEPPAPPPPPPAPLAQAEPPLPSAADIALAREKERKLKEQQEQERLALEKKRKLAQKKQAEAEAKEKKAKAAQEAKEKKKKAQEDKLKAKQQAEQIKKLRAEQMKRMMGLAGGSGEPSDNGSAERSAAPSAGYAGRIRARIRPNIVFTDNISGNPAAEVEVRTSPDGTIVGSKLIKPSGVKSWDEAVLKAIQKTEVLPRDVDGRVPPSLVIVFRPRD